MNPRVVLGITTFSLLAILRVTLGVTAKYVDYLKECTLKIRLNKHDTLAT